MAQRPETIVEDSRAPADRVHHAPWPRWKVIGAYLLMAALAVFSIWFIDRRVHRFADIPAATRPAP